MILFLVGLGCGVGFAALAVYGQVRGGTRLREVGRGVPAAILVAGAIFGGLAYWLDSSIAVTVLTVDVPAVHLLVTDPEKTDGERAPGC